MSRTASASCLDRAARAGRGLALLALFAGGCATTPPPPAVPKPSAAELLAQRFPDRPHTVKSDDGRWLAPWLLRYWALDADPRALAAALESQLKAGYSVEESLLAALPGVGLWAHASLGSWRELAERVEAGCPVIVQIRRGAGATHTRHFIAVTAVDATKVQGVQADGEAWSMDPPVFLTAWESYRKWMMTALPPDRANWRMRSPEYAGLVRYYDAMGEPDRANAMAARALEAEPDNPDLATSLGTRAWQRGQLAEAERLFRAALAQDDRHVRAANNLAYLLARQGRELDEALALSRRAVLQEPANPHALHTQGYILSRSGQWTQARSVLERAWQRSRDLPDAARVDIGLILVEAYRKTGSPHLAPAILDELRVLDPGLQAPADPPTADPAAAP